MPMKRFLILLGLFFLFNFIWEFLHYPLYNDFSGMEKYPRLLVASSADMLILASIFFGISLKNRNLKWIEKPSKMDFILIILAGVIIASYIEIMNLANGEWSYKTSMPTIFGIGISPLIQLFATALLSLRVFGYTNKLRKSN